MLLQKRHSRTIYTYRCNPNLLQSRTLLLRYHRQLHGKFFFGLQVVTRFEPVFEKRGRVSTSTARWNICKYMWRKNDEWKPPNNLGTNLRGKSPGSNVLETALPWPAHKREKGHVQRLGGVCLVSSWLIVVSRLVLFSLDQICHVSYCLILAVHGRKSHYHSVPCLVLSCLALTCLVLSCLILSCVVPEKCCWGLLEAIVPT